MTNLAITSKCNRRCPYCFAGTIGNNTHMSRELYRQLLSFLTKSGLDQVRLLGGEPTLHPDFCYFVELALAHDFQVRVFSNGLMPEDALQCLVDAPEEKLGVLLNINSPDSHGSRESALPDQTLQRLGRKVSSGFNIHALNARPDFLLPLIDRYQLNRVVRLGLAHPAVDGSNVFLRPKDYKSVGRMVADFVTLAGQRAVKVEFDCGFVPCMFPDNFLAASGIEPSSVGGRCGALPDILPSGKAVHCYPLQAARQVEMSPHTHGPTLIDEFADVFRVYRQFGIFPECAACSFKLSGACNGGCLAAVMNRFRKRQDGTATVPPAPRQCSSAITDPPAGGPHVKQRASDCRRVAPWIIPYIDQPLDFWERIYADFGERIGEVYFPLPDNGIGSGRPLQPARYLEDFLGCAFIKRSVLLNPLTLSHPLEKVTPGVVAQVVKLHEQYGLKGVTVANPELGLQLGKQLPDLEITGSVLLDVFAPNQAMMLAGICDNLVPASRIMRDLCALERLRAAFSGKIRLMVNEACLPGCLSRTQHFHEMGHGIGQQRSLCSDMLQRYPWMRLTGSWVLPQHLHFYSGLYDELKLAGRVTLQDPRRYYEVLSAYMRETPLTPDRIGGGPASPLKPLEISEAFFAKTLRCGRRCDDCTFCRDYYEERTCGRSEARFAVGAAP